MSELRTSKLTIVDDHDNEVATLQSAEGGAGLWINTPGGGCVAVYSIKGQTGIGFYDKAAAKDLKGMSFCLTMAGNDPCIQLRDRDGEPFWITAQDLRKLKEAK